MPDLWVDVDAAVEVPVNIFPLIDDGDFKTRETAVAYNAAGMDLVWNFQTPGGAITQTAVTPTTSGVYDWNHLGDGMYKLEIPASGGGSINNDTEGVGWFTGIATGVLAWRGPTIGFRAAGLNDALIESAYSATRGLAGTALPNAAAEASGGLATLSAAQASNGTINANVHRWLTGTPNALSSGRVEVLVGAVTAGVIAAASFAANALDAVWSTTTRVLTAATNLTTALATPTNITAGTITTVTNLTNAPPDSSGVTTLLSRIPSALFTGITSLAQWLGLIAGKQTGNSTARTELRATGGGSGTFDETSDSQEAIRDNMGTAQTGDAYARIGAPAGASVSADLAAVKVETAAILDDTGTSGVVLSSATYNAIADALLARSLGTEAVSADGAVPTVAQAFFEILSEMGEFSISGTTITCKKRDGTTTLFTSTLDSSTAPTSRTRAT